MARIHVNFYETYLETNKRLAEGERFDVAVIGSDEVFNATSSNPWGFTAQLFGEIPEADRVVTYAASCGFTTLEDARKLQIDDEIAAALKNVRATSVRDQNTFDFVKGITGREAEIHVDPVFLANYDPFIKLPTRKKPYLLVYAYSNRINDKAEIDAIKAYAKQNGLEIVAVGMQQRWCSHNIVADAFELLGYVKNAACVVTDTFHGSVFSIKYNKRFVTLIRERNKQKLGGLLRRFGLYDRAVREIGALGSIMDVDIDYERANDFILEEQKRAKAYLDAICETE